MAAELEVTYNGAGATLYAIIRQQSDAGVWSDAAGSFGLWDDQSLADYAIALSDKGGDLYQGDFPSSITAGSRVRLFYYRQQGVAPAASDLLLDSRDWTWTGGSLTPPPEVGLDVYALTTLAGVKRQLRLTGSDDDDLIIELINAVSGWIERLCSRQFLARDYRQWIAGSGREKMLLPQRPLLKLYRIAWGSGNSLSVRRTGSAIRATAQVYDGGVLLKHYTSAGAAVTSDLPAGSYPSTSALVDAINAVSGWEATLLSNQPTADLTPGAGLDALTRAALLTYPDRGDGQYTLESNRGLVQASAEAVWPDEPVVFPSSSQVLVEYRAGYETIPADVEQMARELTAAAYHLGRHDVNVQSENLGTYAATLASSAEMTLRQRALLGPFQEIR